MKDSCCVEFLQSDDSFHLILCRNLAFTYFEASLQRQVLEQILQRLHNGGVLVLGKLEHLPNDVAGLRLWFPKLGVYRRGNGE